jgi:hypothetical protein
MRGPTAAVCFGVPEATVDRLIQSEHARIQRWIVFGTDPNALAALDRIWQGDVEMNLVIMPAVDDVLVPLVEDILRTEGIDMRHCIVVGSGLSSLRAMARDGAWGYVEGVPSAPDELIRAFNEAITH